jgi:O-antigen/teichoic acid export membrane protein
VSSPDDVPPAAPGLTSSSATVVAATVVQRAAGGLAVIVVVRAYGAAVAGVFGALQFLAFAGAAIALLGADSGLVRFVPGLRLGGDEGGERELLRRALVATTVAAVAVAVVLLIALPAWNALLDAPGDDTVRWLVIGTAAALPATVAAGLFAAYARARERFTAFAVVDRATGASVLLVAVAVVAALDLAPGWLALAIVLAPSVAAVVGWFYAREAMPAPAGARSHEPGLSKRFWRFSLPRAPADLITVANARLDTFLVAVLASSAAAGSYQVAARIAVLALLPVNATGATVGPAMARAFARDDRAEVADRYGAATRLATLWSVPVIAALFAWADDLTRLIGSDVADAATPMRLVLVAMAVEVITGRIVTVLLMAGRSALTLVNAGASLATAVVLNIALVPELGGEGAAIAWIAAAVVSNGLATLELARTEHVRAPTVRWLVSSAATMTGSVALVWVAATAPAGTVVPVSLGCVGVVVVTLAAPRLLRHARPGAVLA